MMTRKPIIALLLLASACLFSTEASATLESWGGRAGYRTGEGDFDQFVIGVHADAGDFMENVRFAPNFELGLGSHQTIASFNPDIHYVMRDNPIADATFFYFGGGLGLHVFNFDLPEELKRLGADDTETDIKINVVSGIETQVSDTFGYFGEVRISFIDGTFVEFIAGANLLQ